MPLCLFSGLLTLHLKPADENYTGEILDANMEYSSDEIFWINGDISEEYFHNAPNAEEYTWIKAKNAKWRVVEEFIGEDDVFIYSKEIC